MNRLIATLMVFAMMFVAVLVSLSQTWKLRSELGDAVTWLLGLQVVIAAALIAVGALLVLRRMSAREKITNQRRLSALRPLRRLLSVVWS